MLHHQEQEDEEEEEDKEKMGQKVELEDDLLFEEDCHVDEGELVEEGDNEEEEDEEEMKEPEESTKMKVLRQIADVASKLKEIIGNLITTAGKVVVTILLGLTGTVHSLLQGELLGTISAICLPQSFWVGTVTQYSKQTRNLYGTVSSLEHILYGCITALQM